MIPTFALVYPPNQLVSPFQSRNRETYDSNYKKKWTSIHSWQMEFQSRNRETYDSNSEEAHPYAQAYESFNLVIEKLMIPTCGFSAF